MQKITFSLWPVLRFLIWGITAVVIALGLLVAYVFYWPDSDSPVNPITSPEPIVESKPLNWGDGDNLQKGLAGLDKLNFKVFKNPDSLKNIGDAITSTTSGLNSLDGIRHINMDGLEGLKGLDALNGLSTLTALDGLKRLDNIGKLGATAPVAEVEKTSDASTVAQEVQQTNVTAVDSTALNVEPVSDGAISEGTTSSNATESSQALLK